MGGALLDRPAPPADASSGEVAPARLVIVAILGFWMIAPFLLLGSFAQDAVPFVAAGELARSDPGRVYTQTGDLFVLPEEFARVSCESSPAGTDCANENVAFVSPPPALPLAVGLSILGPVVGPLALRLVVSLCLVIGVVALRRRLLARDPDVDGVLAATLVLLTPMFMVPQALGQTSPLLFLSAALGLALVGRSRPASVGVGILWGLTVAFKLTPIALIVVLVVRRRWTAMAAGLTTVGLLGLAALPLGGVAMWGGFVEGSSRLQEGSAHNPYNVSLEAFVHGLLPGLTGTSSADLLVWGLRAVAVAAVAVVALRIEDEDTQWSFAWLASFLVIPLVWWHYLWVAVAAVAIAVAATKARGPLASPKLLVPLALVSLPLSIADGSAEWVPVAQFAFLAVTLVWCGHLARAPGDDATDGPDEQVEVPV